MAKKAWITLLSTEDYLDAVLTLSLSLKKVKSKYPLVVGLTKDLYQKDIVDILHKFDIWIELIDRYEYSEEVRNKWLNHSVLNTASKINLFKCDSWDKLIYIDADTYLRENLDHLMLYPDGSILYDSTDIPHYGFSGLFVFKPNNHYAEFYQELLQKTNCFDGDFLGKLWFYVKDSSAHQIPFHYNELFYRAKSPDCPYPLDEIKSIHFVGVTKPWKEVSNDLMDNIFIKEYLSLLEEVKQIKASI